MTYKIILLLGALTAMMFIACDWNSHTEPDIKVNNAKVLGGGIFVNKTSLHREGVDEILLNEGDTLKIEMSTGLLNQPNYAFTPQDGDVVKVVKDSDDNMVAWAIAQADSGGVTKIKIVDSGNSNAERMIDVHIVKHWADSAYFDFVGSFAGHYYYLSKNLKGWVQAEEVCREAGGYLVAINTGEENTFLDQARGRIENVWVGARYNLVDGKWKITTWSNGEEYDFKAFNGTGGPGIFAEYYFHMDINGKWESWHEISFNYFLEME